MVLQEKDVYKRQGKDRFDFSEIDAALPAAERMQEKDRLTDTLENNYKAVRCV